MNINDILEIEQLQYTYEQAYCTHRQAMIPKLFVKSEKSVFTLPSANDYVEGWDKINEKFTEELPNVSPNEDSYHNGWQICTPFIWENPATKKVTGFFPTTGYLVVSMDSNIFKPPYTVLSSMEFWCNQYENTCEGWKIKRLQAQFMLGQPCWGWDSTHDDTYATRHELQQIPHPILKGSV